MNKPRFRTDPLRPSGNGCDGIDVLPGSGGWTRCFSDIVGPKGRVYSFVPAEVAHFESDPFGKMQALATETGRRMLRPSRQP
jgi:predicted methyltransferase